MQRLGIVAVCLVIALFAAGCFGGNGSTVSVESQIQALLAQYATHTKNENSEGMANLYVYPAKVIGVGEADGLEIADKDQMKAVFDLGFGLVSTVHSAEISVKSISYSQTTATANVIYTVDATVLGFRETTVSEIEFKLEKVGSTWKIRVEKTISSSTL